MKNVFFAAGILGVSVGVYASPKPAIEGFGNFYLPEGHQVVEKDARFKVAFDVSESVEPGETSKHMNSLARFINMHIADGVEPANIELALVIHGKATRDVLENAFYKERYGQDNTNQKLIEQLLQHNTKVFVCGQSATYYKVEAKQLIPGVTMALSAMTAHAQLQQQGYTLNPF